MPTKVYGIYGKTTVEINLPVGKKASLPLLFERGCLDRKNYRPASFITSNKAVQDMIEDSAYFGRMIKLVKVYGYDKDKQEEKEVVAAPKKVAAAPKPAKEEPAEEVATEYPEVTTKEQLIAVVKAQGAKANILADDAKLKKFISVKGLSFPNYQF